MWGYNYLEVGDQRNFNYKFIACMNDFVIQLTQWQYWWWYWFGILWCFYNFIILKVFRYRTYKFNPKLNTSLRSHGKWGDFLAAILPISWCFNILLNSNFLLRIIEWQHENAIMTIRIQGKQWYWVYKYDVRDFLDIFNIKFKVGNKIFKLNTVDLTFNYKYLNFYKKYKSQLWLNSYNFTNKEKNFFNFKNKTNFFNLKNKVNINKNLLKKNNFYKINIKSVKLINNRILNSDLDNKVNKELSSKLRNIKLLRNFYKKNFYKKNFYKNQNHYNKNITLKVSNFEDNAMPHSKIGKDKVYVPIEGSTSPNLSNERSEHHKYIYDKYFNKNIDFKIGEEIISVPMQEFLPWDRDGLDKKGLDKKNDHRKYLYDKYFYKNGLSSKTYKNNFLHTGNQYVANLYKNNLYKNNLYKNNLYKGNLYKNKLKKINFMSLNLSNIVLKKLHLYNFHLYLNKNRLYNNNFYKNNLYCSKRQKLLYYYDKVNNYFTKLNHKTLFNKIKHHQSNELRIGNNKLYFEDFNYKFKIMKFTDYCSIWHDEHNNYIEDNAMPHSKIDKDKVYVPIEGSDYSNLSNERIEHHKYIYDKYFNKNIDFKIGEEIISVPMQEFLPWDRDGLDKKGLDKKGLDNNYIEDIEDIEDNAMPHSKIGKDKVYVPIEGSTSPNLSNERIEHHKYIYDKYFNKNIDFKIGEEIISVPMQEFLPWDRDGLDKKGLDNNYIEDNAIPHSKIGKDKVYVPIEGSTSPNLSNERSEHHKYIYDKYFNKNIDFKIGEEIISVPMHEFLPWDRDGLDKKGLDKKGLDNNYNDYSFVKKHPKGFKRYNWTTKKFIFFKKNNTSLLDLLNYKIILKKLNFLNKDYKLFYNFKHLNVFKKIYKNKYNKNYLYDYDLIDNQWDVAYNIKNKWDSQGLFVFNKRPFETNKNVKHSSLFNINKLSKYNLNLKKLKFSYNNYKLFEFKISNNNVLLKKRLSDNHFFIMKQKRYQRLLDIKPEIIEISVFDESTKKLTTKKVPHYPYIHLKKSSIRDFLLDKKTVPFNYYKLLQIQKRRTENIPITLCKRLLRSKRVLVMPSNFNVALITNSYDVAHSWYIPGLALKFDCVPGRSTHHTIHIDHPGFYYGQCAEICGRYHHHMPIRMCAISYEHFILWWKYFVIPKYFKYNLDKKFITFNNFNLNIKYFN